jgi:hypothetical protein
MLLDDEDYDNMSITNRLHIKKIRVEIDRIYTPHKKIVMGEEHLARREKIRRHKMFLAAAILIQRQFRRFAAKKQYSMLQEIERIKQAEIDLEERIRKSGFWWTEYKSLHSKKSNALTTIISSSGLKLPPIKDFGRRRDFLSASGWGRRGDDLKGTWVPTQAAVIDKSFMGDVHPTLIYTEKLRINGYDKRRMKQILDDDF